MPSARHRNGSKPVTGLLLTVVAAGLVAGWSRWTSVPQGVSVLPDFGELPAFSLLDQQGQPVTRETFSGSVWIANLIFTRCAGQCPMMSAHMANLQHAFDHLSAIQLVSFSVDPAYDTPRVLAAYAMHYGARASRWRFVTGAVESIHQLAAAGFRLGVAEGTSVAEPIMHSVRFILMDQHGHIRGYYDATEAQAMARLQRDAERLARQYAGFTIPSLHTTEARNRHRGTEQSPLSRAPWLRGASVASVVSAAMAQNSSQ